MKTYKEFITERKPMDMAARKKAARRMSRLAKTSAFKMKVKRAKKKHATPDKLWMRAQKAAKMLIIKKSMPNLNYSALSPAKKMMVDKSLAKKFTKIPAFAKKLVRKLKQQETERMKKAQE